MIEKAQPLGLEEQAYFSPADAFVRFETHPDPRWRGVVLDAAYVRLTAGDTPLHIYNYARSGTPLRGDGASGKQGGAPFDDTALGNRIVRLELILNMNRFRDIRYSLLPMTVVGDFLFAYRGEAWSGEGIHGYYLKNGQVGQAGYDVNVRGATFPAVSVLFDDIVPVVNGIKRGEVPAAPEEPAAEDLEGRSIAGYDVHYTLGGEEHKYNPGFMGRIIRNNRRVLEDGEGTPVVPDELRVVRAAQVQTGADALPPVEALPFQAALIVAENGTWIWNPNRSGRPGYERLSGTIAGQTLSSAELASIRKILFVL